MAGEDRNPLEADLERLRGLTCAKWTWHDPDVLPAWVADMDLPSAPEIVAAVAALVDRGDFGYNFAAERCLPEVWADWQERHHGWRPDPERVRTFCDVMQGVEVALWLHTAPGDGVVLFTPVYHPFIGALKDNARRIVDCPLDPDGWKLDSDRLEAVVDDTTRAILTCNPHNPTGHVFTRQELEAIAEVAERHDLLVISDEIWADLVYPSAKHIPFESLGDEASARTITVTAASKAFGMPGLHCAIAHVGSDALRDGIKAQPRHLFGAVGSPGAEASLAAWTQGEDWLAHTLVDLEARRDQTAARLAAELPGVGFQPPEATYLAWLDFRALGLGPDPAKLLLEKGRVALSSGPDFGVEGEGFARLNMATTPEILDAILDRVIAAAKEAATS